MKAYTYTPDGDGKGKESEIPATWPKRRRKAMKRWSKWWPKATTP